MLIHKSGRSYRGRCLWSTDTEQLLPISYLDYFPHNWPLIGRSCTANNVQCYWTCAADDALWLLYTSVHMYSETYQLYIRMGTLWRENLWTKIGFLWRKKENRQTEWLGSYDGKWWTDGLGSYADGLQASLGGDAVSTGDAVQLYCVFAQYS